MAGYRVIPMSSGEFDVQIEAVTGVRNHRVAVGAPLLARLACDETAGERIVSAAFDYLAEHHELGSLPHFLDLSAYRSRSGFVDDLQRRLATAR
jgi:hypothetical protein